MAQQGWKEGQSLGNRSSAHVGINDVDRLAAARVGVLFKDDNLGLGAKRKSKDVEGQRIGLDAFQGLLGRLNGKSDKELKIEEKKVEDRKLAMYAKGRWGGMVFVKGGTLVGDRDFGTGEDKPKSNDPVASSATSEAEQSAEEDGVANEAAEKRRRKEEKRQRKEARRLRREQKALRKAMKKSKAKSDEQKSGNEDEGESESTHLATHKSPLVQPPDEPISSSSSGNEESKSSKLKRKRSSVTIPEPSKTKPATAIPQRSGRHLLRGRNIQAKKMAFSDMKGLEEIFMKTG